MKNRYEVRGEITAIYIETKSHGTIEALVDTGKLKLIKDLNCNWGATFDKATNSFYVIGPYKNNKRLRLHRIVTNAPDGMVVDHINHNTLDNTTDNLRILTHAQNHQNRKGSDKGSKSGVRGVNWHKRMNKWVAKICINRVEIHLGYFDSIEAARAARLEAVSKYMPFSNEITIRSELS